MYNVSSIFNLKIKSLQFDWGGEYMPLSTLLVSFGITSHFSCPHTHKQNGSIEHKHRHIVETILGILHHSHVSIQFWDDAFQLACYLINHMSTPLLQHTLQFQKLFWKPKRGCPRSGRWLGKPKLGCPRSGRWSHPISIDCKIFDRKYLW